MHHPGAQRRPTGGLLVDGGERQVAVEGERQRARDRRGGHQDQVSGGRLGGDGRALGDAEFMLLIDHHQSQVGEADRLREHRVGAHQHVEVAVGEGREQRGSGRPFGAAGQQPGPHAERLQQPRDGFRMLEAERFRRDHDRRLLPGIDHAGGRQQRHQGLAAAHVALQQPRRGARSVEVRVDLRQGRALGIGQRERQPREHRRPQRAVRPARRPRPAGRRAARQLELQQEQLLVRQSAARRLRRLRGRRPVHARQRLRLVRQAAGGSRLCRNAKRGRPRTGRQGGVDHAPQRRLREPGSGRIDRHERLGGRLLRAHDLEAAGRQPAAAAIEPAVHQHPLAGQQRPAELRAAERVQRGGIAGVVGQRDRRRGAAAIAERSDAHHGGAHAGVAAGVDLRQRQRPPAVLVPARQMGQQVADGAHAEPGQTFPRSGADAAERRHVVVPGKRRDGAFGAAGAGASGVRRPAQNGELWNCTTTQPTTTRPTINDSSSSTAIRLR